MKAKVGDRVVKNVLGHEIFDMTVRSRTERTIATVKTGTDMLMDHRGDPSSYRFYNEAKVKRMNQISQHITELSGEFTELYHSLPKVE